MTKVYIKPTDCTLQMKALSEAGYHTILPAQLYDYLLHDGQNQSFDDTVESNIQ
jgi:hypothetical protein